MAHTQSKGHRRIPIHRIENQHGQYAPSFKQHLSIYKIVSELCTFSYSFSPTTESVIDRYTNPNMEINDFAIIIDSHTRGRISEQNHKLDESRAENKVKTERAKILKDMDKTRQKGWWEEISIEQMNKEQVGELKTWFEYYISKSSI
ncbi:hypothetical protein ACJIZ3_006103 [Penstemon smallii]|uniref:Uncharacterized protein n=1 Tax=Penstemon smallii TaxID=265156 RepID=A0ABD3S776_9LAMI